MDKLYSSEMVQITEVLKNLNLGLPRDGKVELKSFFQTWQEAFKIECTRLQLSLIRRNGIIK